MKFDNQLRYASNIIEDYKGEKPLAAWLKEFFRANKQMGSRDRKTVAELLYNFYRLGHALKATPVKEKILAGLFLCNDAPIELLGYFKPEWNRQISLPLPQKIALINEEPSLLQKFSVTDIFPWHNELSENIDSEAFCQSFLIQPDLFLRIRPAKANALKEKLDKAGISYKSISPSTLALPNATKLDDVIETDQDAVIQDYSSQKAGELIKLINNNLQPKIKVWDSCAASGGKSIMAFDINPAIQLTVSDVRDVILENLHRRFQRAGIKNYTSFVADLGWPADDKEQHPAGNTLFDLIIADLPCTGSGTWSRTPEQLYFFKPEKIVYYNNLQKRIIDNVIPALKKGGALLYITCSVFRKENEAVVDHIIKAGLTLKHREVLKGYHLKADSMFAAIFTL